MLKSLYLKLALALFGLFFVLGIFIVLLTQFVSDMYQQEVMQKLNRNLAQKIVAQQILIQDDRINLPGLKKTFDMIMVVNPSIEVYLLDPFGGILAFSAPAGKVKRTRVDLKPINQWLENNLSYPLMGDDPRSLTGKKVFSVARILEEGRLQGYLYVILGGEVFDNILQRLKGSYILQLSAWWIGASLFFVLVAGLMLFAYLTRRLKRLALVMDSFDIEQTPAQLQLMLPETRHQGDEIDRLTFTFKQLAERIQTQIEKLREADSLRRELIANVSHDLRTPLANLRGYIETLFLKDKSLSAEERRQHLEIAIRHCSRLSKLIDELFELAKLDSRRIDLNCEPFNISELVHDVVQKSQLAIRKKLISIEIELDQSLPFVNADIAMVERVIENLLENAVRHTPEGGSIRISFGQDDGDLFVCVNDTGSGISKEDLPFIFDRFYQRDKTRMGEAGYAGLGLAIAKRILELHNGSLSVESTPGFGTTFTFHLPAYKPL